MDNRTNRMRQQTLWQRFPNSAKVCIAIAVVLIILALLCSYAIKLWADPMAASQITIFVIVVLVAGIVTDMIAFGILTFARADETYIEANILFRRAQSILDTTQDVLDMTQGVSGKAGEVLDNVLQEGFFATGTGEEWDDAPESHNEELSPEYIARLLQEIKESGPQEESNPIDKHYESIIARTLHNVSGKATDAKIEAEPEDTDENAVQSDLEKTRELEKIPRSQIGLGNGKVVPIVVGQDTKEIDTKQIEAELNKRPDSLEPQPEEQPEPQPQSIEEQVAELGLPDTTVSLLAYLLKTGGYNHYSELPPKQRKQLEDCKRLSSAG